jgi:glycosyltransferase involved in cell wall biosynthesis
VAEGVPSGVDFRTKLPTVRRARPRSPGESTIQAGAVGAGLVLLSYLFRLPPLLNARSTNSDAAIVGLQAMHVLGGERSPFLWGSGYQTSADAFVAAAFFAVLGPTPFALMVSALTLHVLATWLVFATLRRRLDPWLALVLTLPLVLAPSSIHTYALYPPRQLAITLAVSALWAIDGGAQRGPRASRWLAAGGVLYGLAISADPYPMVLAPIVLGYGVLVAFDHPKKHLPRLVVATLVGLVPFLLLHQQPRGRSGPMGLDTRVVGHNWDLLVRECLPWALSYKVYYARNVMDYHAWDAPMVVRVVQIVGALVVAGIVLFGLGAMFLRSMPLVDRRLGFIGAMAYPVALGAFLVSVMVMDHFSMRYLAVLTTMLPFAAMPAARMLGRRRFALLFAPHLVASAIGGWVGYGPFVRGALPVSETPELRDDYALFDLLQARGITYAEADYWTSYRLTFLFGERIVVVPTNPAEDRWAPYREAFSAAPRFAYVFDPGRSRENLAEAEAMLARTSASIEKTHAGGHTVFVVTRH